MGLHLCKVVLSFAPMTGQTNAKQLMRMLNEIRAAHALTWGQTADRAGISLRTLMAIKNERKEPSDLVLYRVKKYLASEGQTTPAK